jgi:hypothetical protein
LLVQAAEEAGFEVLVTGDQELVYQQNMQHRKIALVVLSTNKASLVSVNAKRILGAIDDSKVGGYCFVDIGY